MTFEQQLSIPTIDISPWLSEELDFYNSSYQTKATKNLNNKYNNFDNNKEKERVCDEIRNACRQWGFLILVGLPRVLTESVIPDAAEESRRFFTCKHRSSGRRFDENTKQKEGILSSPAYGYFGMESESLSYNDNDGEKKPDLREAFSMGPVSQMSDRLKLLYGNDDASENVSNYDKESKRNSRRHNIHKHILDFCYQPTPWPEEGKTNRETKSFQSSMTKFYITTSKIGRVLLKILAKCLDLPEDHFSHAALEGEHCNSARAIWYPKLHKKSKPGQYRCGPHTDSGVLTLLWTDGSGLEIQVCSPTNSNYDKNSKNDDNWIPVENVPSNALVMNIGDILQEASGHLYNWRSTPHRVLAPKLDDKQRNQDRLVLVLFLILAADFPIPNCNIENNNNKHPRKTQGEHLFDQFQKWTHPSNESNLQR